MTRVHRMQHDDEDDFYDERPVRRRKAQYGIAARALDAALRNPMMAAGTVISGLAIVIIVTNALSNQPMHHPSPLFNTRPNTAALPPVPAATPQSMPPVAAGAAQIPPQPVAQVAAVQTTQQQAQPATVTQATAPAPVVQQIAPPVQPAPLAPPVQTTASTSAAPLAPSGPSPQVIERIQRDLHERGFYNGSVDGIAGPATSEAVRAFEQRLGVTPNGEANEHVLQLLHTARGRNIRMPVAVAAKPAAVTQPQPQPVVQRAAMQPMPSPVSSPVPPEPLTASEEGKIQKIQRGLNRAGYGMVRTDGRMDEGTVAAIKRFEIEHGMPVTGRVSDRILGALGTRSASAD